MRSQLLIDSKKLNLVFTLRHLHIAANYPTVVGTRFHKHLCLNEINYIVVPLGLVLVSLIT